MLIKEGDMVRLNIMYKKELLDEYDESVLDQVFEVKFLTTTGIAKIEHELGIRLQIPIKYLSKF